MDANYTKVCDTTRDAIKTDTTSRAKWASAGSAVQAFFVTADALKAVKPQFIADAIIPAMDKRHRDALDVALPRKGSKEHEEYVAANGAEKWEAANQAKKDARAISHTYFARVMQYAFPPEKSEPTVRDLKTRINQEIAALVNACQKAESAPFDVAKVIAALENVQTVVNK